MNTMIILDRCFDLAVHHDATKGVVVLEYASEGHVVGTGRRYANRYISELTLREGEVAHWRDYLDPVAVFDALGCHADLPPAMLVMRHGKQGNAAGLSRKSTEHK
jgi:hypothetical protein